MSSHESPFRYVCEECGRHVTIGQSGTEYGHERGRGHTGDSERCPRRPESVDPTSAGPDRDEWTHWEVES